MNYDFFINHPEIEDFGVTPYKAGSNRLQRNRIILKETTAKQIKGLIDNSYIPLFAELPNPVLDLFVIADLIKKIKVENYGFKVPYFDNTKSSREGTFKFFMQEFHEYFK